MPKKTRVPITREVSDRVLKEYNHLCAVCAGPGPQLHHIDETPSNNDPLNLLPLCPNCHITDHHHPTKPVDPRKLALFRKFKDPTILGPQFDPLFSRMLYLEAISDDISAEQLEAQSQEIIDFVAALEMGGFYSKRLQGLLNRPRFVSGDWLLAEPDYQREREREQERAEDNQRYREQLRAAQQAAYALLIELLRYQKWEGPQRK